MEGGRVKPDILHLCRVAARETGLVEREIMSRRRYRRIAWPRFAVMLVAHEGGCSYPRIAQRLGMKDHTSVMHGCRRAVEIEAAEPSFAALMTTLRQEISPLSTPTSVPCEDEQIHPHANPHIAPRKSVDGASLDLADFASEGA
jgi:hypothetical protein